MCNSDDDSSLRPPATTTKQPPPIVFTRHDLRAFHLLQIPIWIFDATNKAMWWANHGGLALWNAQTVDELLARDFASDMSDATAHRLAEYMVKFQRGERVDDQVCNE
jgi:hypothetical protein